MAEYTKDDMGALHARIEALEQGGTIASSAGSSARSWEHDPRSVMRGTAYSEGNRWDHFIALPILARRP